MITASIVSALQTDVILTPLLAKNALGKPAVYGQDPPPGDAQFPLILSPGNFGDLPFDTKTSEGRDIQRDVAVYGKTGDGVAIVEEIAERLREIFHNTSFSVQGWGTVLSEVVSGPVANDGDGTVGRVLTVRLVIE